MLLLPKFRLLAATLATLLLVSCAKEEKPVLPHTLVNIIISTNMPDYISLQNPATGVKISYYNSLPVGYLGNGVIVYNSLEGFKAYDATCPNSDFKSIEIVDQIYGECPSCKTRYSLESGFAMGKGNLHLQRYSVMSNGEYLNIYN